MNRQAAEALHGPDCRRTRIQPST